MDFHLSARGPDRNYTGILTKTIVYTSTLVVFLVCKFWIFLFFLRFFFGRDMHMHIALMKYWNTDGVYLIAFALTISSVIIPNWISYYSEKVHIYLFYFFFFFFFFVSHVLVHSSAQKKRKKKRVTILSLLPSWMTCELHANNKNFHLF